MRRTALRAAAALAIAVIPAWAQAHNSIPGVGHFYNGLFHPFIVPAQLMALAALGMLMGQRGLALTGRPAAALTVAMAVGLVSSTALGAPETDLLLLGACIVVALGVALAWQPRNLVAVPGSAAIGLLCGLGSNPDGLEGGPRWAFWAGACLGACLFWAWAASMTEAARQPWMKIAVRVAASWLAASALLVQALYWVGPGKSGKLNPVGLVIDTSPLKLK